MEFWVFFLERGGRGRVGGWVFWFGKRIVWSLPAWPILMELGTKKKGGGLDKMS